MEITTAALTTKQEIDNRIAELNRVAATARYWLNSIDDYTHELYTEAA